jgi:chromate transporter
MTSPAVASTESATVLPHLSCAQIFWRFLQFGLMAWGGPVAQIAMLRRELVEREHWMSSVRFNRLLALFQVLPGPEAHEMCVYFGTLPGGRVGGLLAGLGFMLPGFVLMFALSWLYFRVDLATSALAAVFMGMQPAVIALIVRAVHRIGAHVLADVWLWGIAVLSAGAALGGVTFWITLPLAGISYASIRRGWYVVAGTVTTLGAVAALAMAVGVGQGSVDAVPATVLNQDASLLALFLSGLKAGLLTFGGAYTVIPFLRDDAVGQGWMTPAQFVDGLALSGILPAPLIIFSTFVGYVAAGPAGAVAMTVGIFLPAFYFALFLHGHLGRVIDDVRLHTFLEGVAAGVVGLIAATTLELAAAVTGRLPALAPGIAIFAISLALLYVWKIRTNVVFILMGAGFAGWMLF